MSKFRTANKTANAIVVIGSVNMDLVCRTPHMPAAGETILGSDFVTISGGKGANQAVAAAKLSRRAPVYMVGRVGDDDFGQRLLNGLKQHRVKTDFVTVTEGVSSGVAMILVDGHGENSIVVVPGANAHLSPDDIDAARDIIAQASVVVMQLEVPLATIRHAMALCRELEVFTILDPAPAPIRGLPRDLYDVDLLTPNQTEAEILLSARRTLGRMKRIRRVDAKQIGDELLAAGVKQVVLKLGSRGAMSLTSQSIETAEGFKVKVVDTTAAGDAFTGALAVARAEGMSLQDTLRLANAAGALCCTAFGAQPAVPDRKAVDALMQS